MESILETIAQSILETITESILETITESITESILETITESILETINSCRLLLLRHAVSGLGFRPYNFCLAKARLARGLLGCLPTRSGDHRYVTTPYPYFLGGTDIPHA